MAKLTAKKRGSLPASTFAGPDRSYPIPDKGHVKAALARASEFHHPEIAANVRRKAKKKFPGMKFKMDGGKCSQRADKPRRK
jgi:hypothetical protein